MTIQNGWLPLIFDENYWGVKFGTLSGTGFDTLSEIPYRDPNRRDVSLGNWDDGKPAGKVKTVEGDGSVLLSSSQILGANSSVINQTHAGLVGSAEGMGKILEFLGTVPSSPSSTFVEPNSALIIIADPANFWITDGDGRTKKDKDGMVAFVNPKSGNFQVNFFLQSNETLFIVAQFLPNGQILYKEYKLSGFLPKFKTLKFNAENPAEDILN